MMQRDPLIGSVWANAIAPALASMPPAMGSPQAWHMIIAAGLQESGLSQRAQVVNGGGRGPARGLWQNELGGVRAVLGNVATRDHAARLCADRGINPPDARTVWARLETDDVLAAGFARLFLWAAPARLPDRDQQAEGWALYVDAWRPGKPHAERWADNWLRARLFVYGG